MKGTIAEVSEIVAMRRRDFIAGASMMFLGTRLAGASPLQSQTAPKGPELSEELSAAEVEIVNRSVMAKEVADFFGKGHSCAEAGLAVALRFLKKPQDLVWAAGGFGGGLYNGDLCGFVTAGAMAIGIYAGTLEVEKMAAKEICVQKTREFWQWWTSTAPLHCAQIREGRKDLKVCDRLGKLAAAKVEDLIKPA